MNFVFSRFALQTAESIRQDDIDRLSRIRIPRADEWAGSLAADVAHGNARLSHVTFDGKRVGSFLWRIESDVERELVVMSVAVEPGFQLTSFLFQAVDALAAAEKCETARFNTIRPGLVKNAKARGWFPSEIVMRKTYVS